jgi:inorganic pyrophosphatase
MEDEAGGDNKLLAVPIHQDAFDLRTQWKRRGGPEPHAPEDHPALLRALQGPGEGKWVKVLGWEGVEAAHKEIVDGVANFEKSQAGAN